MNSKLILLNSLRWFVLLFIQVFLLRNMGFYNLSTPFIYILFLMLLPFNTPNFILYVLAFATGITIDSFYDTLGVHTSACIVLAFVRIMFISVSVTRDGFDEPEPTLGNMGIKWFILFAALCILSHHLVLFLLEAFKFSELSYTLLRCLISSFFTFCLILLTESIFYNKSA
ncbi:MAG: rod shape-determining protein MreD [Chitinophagaceae bacterium]|nr:MAG: rod shape-determining protein MreD [Chitinophagaceae bacterium]